MKYLRRFNESKSQKEIGQLVNDLLDTLRSNNIISADNISIKKSNGQELLNIDGIGNIWVRKSSILGYYPGEMQTFFHISANHEPVITDIETYDRLINIIEKVINDIKSGKSKTTKGEFKIDNFDNNYQSGINPSELIKKINPKVKNRVLDIWHELNKN